MAFDKNALTRIGFAPVGVGDVASIYAYFTADAVATVETAAYFTGFADFKKGDIILASMVRGGTAVLKAYIVASATSAGVPTLALLTTT